MLESDPTSTVGTLLSLAFILFAFALAVGVFAFWIWMLIDCLKHEKDQGNDKIVWILVLIFLHWIGALLYYFLRRRERLNNPPPNG